MKKFFIHFLCCFIWNKKVRRDFRKRHLPECKKKEELILFEHKLDVKLNRIEAAVLYAMPTAKGKLREIQLNIYNLLKILKNICEENEISFWLQGGTLLGAVRHHGFIPWDDDVDCGMFRKDLRKLKKALENHNQIEYVECYNVNQAERFVCRMPKIRLKNAPHIFVDIFPYDLIKNNPEDISWQMFLDKKSMLTQDILALGFDNPDIPLEDPDLKKRAEDIIQKYIPAEIDEQEATHIIWGIENLPTEFCRLYQIDSFFPLKKLLFEDDIYSVPKEYDAYLERQYGNIWALPKRFASLEHLNYLINTHNLKLKNSKKILGYTAGAFDLFHVGHLNLLKNAKSKCDYLIVGVTSDDLIEKTKGKRPFISLSERMEIVKNCKYVDEVVIQDDLDKFEAWKNYKYDILFSGNDWEHSPRWQEYEKKLKAVGCSICWFPYTKTTSSSKIQKIINERDEQ